MHYSNGRAARAGDLVRGKGYNLNHEIVGVLVYANPGASSCNCQIATVTTPHNLESDSNSSGEVFLKSKYPSSLAVTNHFLTIEYGQLDAFVAIDPKTGAVLPVEEPYGLDSGI
jgi:hypothetical protein